MTVEQAAKHLSNVYLERFKFLELAYGMTKDELMEVNRIAGSGVGLSDMEKARIDLFIASNEGRKATQAQGLAMDMVFCTIL